MEKGLSKALKSLSGYIRKKAPDGFEDSRIIFHFLGRYTVKGPCFRRPIGVSTSFE